MNLLLKTGYRQKNRLSMETHAKTLTLSKTTFTNWSYTLVVCHAMIYTLFICHTMTWEYITLGFDSCILSRT